MGKGSSTPTQTSSTVTQTNLPEYAEPYFTRLMERAEGQSLAPYQAYGGPRIAGPGGDVNASRDLTRGIAGTGIAGLPAATQGMAGMATQSQQMANNTNPYQYGPRQDFIDPGVASSYMSPYIQNVLDVQKGRAQRDFNEQEGFRNTAAVQAGAFGGSRRNVEEGVAQRGLLDRMGEIDAMGLQNAYQQAQVGFDADRASELARQQSQAGENVASMQSKLGAMDFSSNQLNRMVGFGEMARAGDIQNAQLLETIGRSEQGERQQGYDLAYEDFVRQQAYPEQQLGVMSSVLSGVPVKPTSTQIGYTPYNPMQQLLGAGIAGVGLYKGLQA